MWARARRVADDRAEGLRYLAALCTMELNYRQKGVRATDGHAGHSQNGRHSFAGRRLVCIPRRSHSVSARQLSECSKRGGLGFPITSLVVTEMAGLKSMFFQHLLRGATVFPVLSWSCVDPALAPTLAGALVRVCQDSAQLNAQRTQLRVTDGNVPRCSLAIGPRFAPDSGIAQSRMPFRRNYAVCRPMSVDGRPNRHPGETGRIAGAL
jgi:hypothetical protein